MWEAHNFESLDAAEAAHRPKLKAWEDYFIFAIDGSFSRSEDGTELRGFVNCPGRHMRDIGTK
jgi:hypothetical protein